MMRMTIAIGLTALLAACGGSASSTSENTTTATSIAAVTGGVEGSNNCSKNPDFVAIYAGGTIRVCSSAHFDATHKTSGSVSYTTPAAPAAVLAWSKEQAVKAGLPERMSTDSMVSVGEANKRTMAVFALPDGSGSKVTVNWTNPD